MKHLILLCFFSFLFTTSFAQLTTNNAGWPSIGSSYDIETDSLTTGIMPGAAGASQTWNLSALTPDSLQTVSFVDKNSTPNGSSFPTATVSFNSGGIDFYMSQNATDLLMLGLAGDLMGTGTPLVIPFTTPEVLSKVGQTYNSNYNTNSGFIITIDGSPFGVDSVRINNSQSINRDFDGWGNVTIPLGTFPCLRYKETRINNTVVDILINVAGFPVWQNVQSGVDTSWSYNYIDNYLYQPIVTLNMDTLDQNVTDATYRVDNPTNVLELSLPSVFAVYPNPALSQSQVIVGGLHQGIYQLNVSDLNGKILYSKDLTMANFNDIQSIELPQFSNGLYAVTLSKNGQVIQSLKLLSHQ